LTWEPTYATVAGVLPPEAMPTWKTLGKEGVSVSLLRTQLEATSAAKARLKLDDTTGLSLWLDGEPLALKPGQGPELSLSPGLHTLTVQVDRKIRQTGLRIELDDTPGSVGVRFVAGKWSAIPMSYETLYAAVAPVFESYGMEMTGPEESYDFLTVTDMVAFGLVATGCCVCLTLRRTTLAAVLRRLGPFGAGPGPADRSEIRHLDHANPLRSRRKGSSPRGYSSGINGTSWAAWQAEAAQITMTEAFLDECVQTMVKMTWFEVAEEAIIEDYLKNITVQRMLEALHETISRQAQDLGIPVL
jgi:hypothetical protein